MTDSSPRSRTVPWKRMRVVVAAAALVLLAACGASEKKSETTESDNLGTQLNLLYRGYLTNEVREAKHALQQAVELLEAAQHKAAAEDSLWLGYGRLFCLESNCGDSNLARLYYEKAKYWRLRNLEADGKSPREILTKLDAFTPRQCSNTVIEWDGVFSGGKGPRYLSDIHGKSAPSSHER